MKFLVYSSTNSRSIESNLGGVDYSYHSFEEFDGHKDTELLADGHEALNIDPFEVGIRSAIGAVMSPQEVPEVRRFITQMLSHDRVGTIGPVTGPLRPEAISEFLIPTTFVISPHAYAAATIAVKADISLAVELEMLPEAPPEARLTSQELSQREIHSIGSLPERRPLDDEASTPW